MDWSDPFNPLNPLSPFSPFTEVRTEVSATHEPHNIQMDKAVLTWTGIIVALILAGLVTIRLWRKVFP